MKLSPPITYANERSSMPITSGRRKRKGEQEEGEEERDRDKDGDRGSGGGVKYQKGTLRFTFEGELMSKVE